MEKTDLKRYFSSYKHGSRSPEAVAAYNQYMREYMARWRRGLCGAHVVRIQGKPYMERKRKEIVDT